jgi:hypothetical protein
MRRMRLRMPVASGVCGARGAASWDGCYREQRVEMRLDQAPNAPASCPQRNLLLVYEALSY